MLTFIILGNRSGYRLSDNATGTAGLESMLNALNGTTYRPSKIAPMGNLSPFTGTSRTQNVSANNNRTINITRNSETSIFNENKIPSAQKLYGSNVLFPSNTSHPNINDTLALSSGFNTKSHTIPLNSSSTSQNTTSTLVSDVSNTSLPDSIKTCCAATKSETTALNGIINTSSLKGTKSATTALNGTSSANTLSLKGTKSATNALNGTSSANTSSLKGTKSATTALNGTSSANTLSLKGTKSATNALNGTSSANTSSLKGTKNATTALNGTSSANTSSLKGINKSGLDGTTFLNSSVTTVSNKTVDTNSTINKAGNDLNAINKTIPSNNYTLFKNSTRKANSIDAFSKDLTNATDHSNSYLTNASKSSNNVVSKSVINPDFNRNNTTGSTHILNASIMNPLDATNHSNISIPNASIGGDDKTINGTILLNSDTLLNNETSNAGTRSILNAFLIQAMNEKESTNPNTMTNNASKTTSAGTRSDFFVSNGIGYFDNSVNGINYSKNKSINISNTTNNIPAVVGTEYSLDFSNGSMQSNSSTSSMDFSSTAGINNSSLIPLNITGYSNSSAFVKDNTGIIDIKKYLNASKDDNNANTSSVDALGNIVTLINNLTDSNWTANPLNMTSSGETISSIAKLINSLNGLNWTDHSNTSSDDNNTAINSTASNLLSAADLNDTLLERFTNVGNLNDTLAVRLRDYFQAMNLTADPNPWGISINDSLRERIKSYLDALNMTNYTNKTIAKTKSLLENAKKFPTISNILEKGKGYLERNLGVTIDDKQVANLINHFINWRDQSASHPCLTDILNAREVNECFAKLAGCRDVNSTSRNVISNLRNFFTCRDKKKSRNAIFVGNYTMKRQREQLKINETQEKVNKTNENLFHKSEASSQDGTNSHGKHLEKWMFDEPDCDDSINALEKCQFEKTKVENKALNDIKGSSSGRPNKTLNVASDCDEDSNVLGRCKLNGKYQAKRRNKTADCEDSSADRCKFKMSLSKFMKDTCEKFEDSYKNCKTQKEWKTSLRSNGTCEDEIKALDKCRNKVKEGNKIYEEDCDGSASPKARCFIMNHLSSTTFSGNIEKADIVEGIKTIDGARNETMLNETTDFQMGNDSYTMKNLTSFQECEGCLKNNETGEKDNFLNYNTEKKKLSKSNPTDDKNAFGDFLKKFEIKKISSKCYQPSIFEMWKSQDDDDQNTAKDECFGINKRRLITKHVTNRNKETSSNGTVVKDKTTEGTKVTDDEGKQVKQDKEQTQTADHAKILQDILSGKHEEDNNNAKPEKPIETDENRTIPIDPSTLTQKQHDLQNPDADVGIVGIDTNPAIEMVGKEKQTNDNSKTNNNNNEDSEGNDQQQQHDKNDDNSKTNTKPKEGESYWLGDDSDNKNTSGGNKTSDEDKIKRILCFGDSITKGYYQRGRKYHPYTIKLEALLKEDNIKVEVINHGINGECISLKMQKRLATDLEELPKLDLVIILGGTNDLLNLDCVRKLDLFQEIKNLHILVRAKGYKSVVVTIPEAKMNKEGTDTMTLIEYRKELDDTNQKLRMYSIASKLPIIDLADDFTRHTMPGKTNVSAMWDDNIHPSREGYDRIGEIIYGQIKDLL